MDQDISRKRNLISKGIVVGSFVGVVLGGFCSQLITDAVIRRDDFSHPLLYEQAERRLFQTLLIASTIAGAALGVVLTWTGLGARLLPAVSGSLAGIALIVVIALPVACHRNERPFNHMKDAESHTIDVARRYGLPLAILVGAAGGSYFAWRQNQNVSG